MAAGRRRSGRGGARPESLGRAQTSYSSTPTVRPRSGEDVEPLARRQPLAAAGRRPRPGSAPPGARWRGGVLEARATWPSWVMHVADRVEDQVDERRTRPVDPVRGHVAQSRDAPARRRAWRAAARAWPRRARCRGRARRARPAGGRPGRCPPRARGREPPRSRELGEHVDRRVEHLGREHLGASVVVPRRDLLVEVVGTPWCHARATPPVFRRPAGRGMSGAPPVPVRPRPAAGRSGSWRAARGRRGPRRPRRPRRAPRSR